MKLLALISLFLSTEAFSKSLKGIYGNDDRVSSNSNQISSKQRYFKRGVAASVSKFQIKSREDSSIVKIVGRPYGLRSNICKDEAEAFKDELVISTCTGFLVKDDLLLTAAHCVVSDYACRTSRWVFDYNKSSLHSDKSVYLLDSSIYSCKEVVARNYDPENRIDYALVRLDRKAQNRPILPLRSEGELSDEDSVYTLGFPQGLSLKYVLSGKIIDNAHQTHFVTDLDTFKGNSGSPVFSKQSGLVEGVVVSGDDDFTWDSEEKCKRIKKCAEGECSGEVIMRISEVIEL